MNNRARAIVYERLKKRFSCDTNKKMSTLVKCKWLSERVSMRDNKEPQILRAKMDRSCGEPRLYSS